MYIPNSILGQKPRCRTVISTNPRNSRNVASSANHSFRVSGNASYMLNGQVLRHLLGREQNGRVFRRRQLRRRHYGTFHCGRKSFTDQRRAFPTVVYSTSPHDRTGRFPPSLWKTIPGWHPWEQTAEVGGPGSCVLRVVNIQAATQAKLSSKPDSARRGWVPAAELCAAYDQKELLGFQILRSQGSAPFLKILA